MVGCCEDNGGCVAEAAVAAALAVALLTLAPRRGVVAVRFLAEPLFCLSGVDKERCVPLRSVALLGAIVATPPNGITLEPPMCPNG